MINKNEPAFPLSVEHSKLMEDGYSYVGTGLTKRERFVMAFMQAIITNNSECLPYQTVDTAMTFADAALAKLSETT